MARKPAKRLENKPAYKANDEDAKEIDRCMAAGFTAEQVSRAVRIPLRTLWRHYKDELQAGGAHTNNEVVGALYKSAMSGNVAAQIFWTKARLRWREVTQHELTGEDGGAINIIFRRKDA